MPHDFIINKGDASNDIFFIVDGTVHLIAEDQTTIVMTLTTGQYFGEIGVLSGAKRSVYV
jgi:CRP-like cAMP-binding protein